ncbi:hypothetical protein FF38_03568, partial [Lucilia cuprina]
MSDIKIFRDVLTQLSTVKPPGVSGSRIRKLADFAVKNPKIQGEVVDTFLEICKESPASNKLGMMYVLDAIIRGYQDMARRQPDVPDFQAGVDSFKSQMNDFMEVMEIRSQSSEQFDKMRKLLDIWAKAGTFSSESLNETKEKYFYEPYTTTPPGSPPAEWAGLPPDTVQIKKKEAPDANALLGVLQNLAQSKPNTNNSNNAPNSPTKANVQMGQPAQPQSQPAQPNLLQQLMSQAQAQPTSGTQSPVLSQAPNLASYTRGRDDNKTATHEQQFAIHELIMSEVLFCNDLKLYLAVYGDLKLMKGISIMKDQDLYVQRVFFAVEGVLKCNLQLRAKLEQAQRSQGPKVTTIAIADLITEWATAKSTIKAYTEYANGYLWSEYHLRRELTYNDRLRIWFEERGKDIR